jgi:hypothetical protein
MQSSGFELTNLIFISTLAPYPSDMPTREHGQQSDITFSSAFSSEIVTRLRNNFYSFFLKLGRHTGVLV